MREWVVIHKIEALYGEGRGMSIKGISRNTVWKYLRMEGAEVAEMLDNPPRRKVVDDCEEYIWHLFEEYPGLSAVKVRDRLPKK